MPDTITILAEKIGTLTLEGGVEVKIVQVEGGGMRLFFDRPLAYCQDCVTFEGEEEAEDGREDAASPVRRAFRKGPPPAVRMAIKRRERDKITGMGMFD
jgi:hypothetical protein